MEIGFKEDLHFQAIRKHNEAVTEIRQELRSAAARLAAAAISWAENDTIIDQVVTTMGQLQGDLKVISMKIRAMPDKPKPMPPMICQRNRTEERKPMMDSTEANAASDLPEESDRREKTNDGQ